MAAPWGASASLVAAVLVCLTASALAQDTGRAVATASDSLSLNGRSYQLFGIDGLELNQSCFVDGQAFACGASAVRALQTLLDPGTVSCTPKGASESGAPLAVCTGFDGDIALKLVEQGWALADRSGGDDYATAEDAARASRAGAWAGTFLTPSDYRDQIAAVEASYAQRAGEASRGELEEVLTAGKIDLGGLAAIVPSLASVSPNSGAFEDHEFTFGGFAPGFIAAAIQPPDVFTWTALAEHLETTRREGVADGEADAAATVLEALVARPAQTIATKTAADFYAALKSSSASWIAEGRQPVLFVMAQDRPSWIRLWFAGQPPAGATVTRREGVTDADYLGTIDGIDVYIGPGRETASLLVPSDILETITYRTDGEGRVLSLQANASGKNEWLLRFAMALGWREDLLTWLSFPPMAAPTPDAG
jgi:endonuclease YncB( thermonuclease family)